MNALLVLLQRYTSPQRDAFCKPSSLYPVHRYGSLLFVDHLKRFFSAVTSRMASLGSIGSCR